MAHGAGDGASRGKARWVTGATGPPGVPANAALYDLARAPAGRRGRPALKGARLGRPADLAATASWQQAKALRYGRTDTIQIAIVDCIWYGSFGNAPGRCVLVRDEDSAKACDLALFTLDPAASPAQVVERYAIRWSIERGRPTADRLPAGPQPGQEPGRADHPGRAAHPHHRD